MLKNKFLHTITILIMAFVMSSCEKVVDLKLEDAPQSTVVEAIVHDSIGDNYVIISKSKPFNDNVGGFETVSGASVVISDNTGNSFALNEIRSGVYNSPSLKGIAGRTYFLSINADGKSITAQSVMQARVNLDSLSQEKVNKPFSSDTISEYRIFTHFYDTPGYKNYYRLKASSKTVQQKGVLVLNDNLIEGDHVIFPIFQTNFLENDTVLVQLLSIEEENFRYFNALTSSQNGEVPGNPETNLNGDDNVVGYFAAYAKSQRLYVIQHMP